MEAHPPRKRATQTAATRDIVLCDLWPASEVTSCLCESPLHLREIHAHQPGAPRFLHGHAVEHIGGFHRAAAVGDDDELGVAGHVADQAHEALVVDLVERGVDFVEDAEGRWLM